MTCNAMQFFCNQFVNLLCELDVCFVNVMQCNIAELDACNITSLHWECKCNGLTLVCLSHCNAM